MNRGEEGIANYKSHFWSMFRVKNPIQWGPEFFGAPMGEQCFGKTIAAMKWAAVFSK